MEKLFKVLAINPGSTSTKIAIYENEKEILEKTLRHSSEEIDKFEKIADQLDFRKDIIESVLKEAGINLSDFVTSVVTSFREAPHSGQNPSFPFRV